MANIFEWHAHTTTCDSSHAQSSRPLQPISGAVFSSTSLNSAIRTRENHGKIRDTYDQAARNLFELYGHIIQPIYAETQVQIYEHNVVQMEKDRHISPMDFCRLKVYQAAIVLYYFEEAHSIPHPPRRGKDEFGAYDRDNHGHKNYTTDAVLHWEMKQIDIDKEHRRQMSIAEMHEELGEDVFFEGARDVKSNDGVGNAMNIPMETWLAWKPII